MTKKFEIAVIVLKTAGSLFSFIACIVCLGFLLYCKLYKSLSHRLFIVLLVSSSLFSFAILFEALGVNVLILIEGNISDVKSHEALCTTAGVLFHYSIWVDILVLAVLATWLARITTKTRKFNSELDKEKYKKKIRQRVWEVIGFLVLFLLPIPPNILTIIKDKYQINEGNWCRLQLKMNATEPDRVGLAEALLAWYIPVIIGMIYVILALGIGNLNIIRKWRSSPTFLKDTHSDILKDALLFSIFVIVVYAMYGLSIFTSLYYTLTDESEVPLWIIEACATVIRGVAVLYLFFNKRMRTKILKNKRVQDGDSKLIGYFIDNKSNENEESLLTPSIITSDFEIIQSNCSSKTLQPIGNRGVNTSIRQEKTM